MSDVEKVGDDNGAPDGRLGRPTLKLGDKLRVSLGGGMQAAAAKSSLSRRSVMTVEVRKSKKKGYYGSSDGQGVFLEKGEEGNSTDSLTLQEKLSRLNAISTADSLNAATGAEVKAEVEDVQDVVDSGSVVELPVAESKKGVDDVYDAGAIVSPVVEDAFRGAAGKGGVREDASRKYGKGHREKEIGSRKPAPSVRYKYAKQVIEEALEVVGEEKKQVQRSSAVKGRRCTVRGSRDGKIVREVAVPDRVSVRDLSATMAEKVKVVLQVLSRMGVSARADTELDSELACEVVSEFGHVFRVVTSAQMEKNLSEIESDALEQEPRAPVVTVMGHVDHGKTSLLDAIRHSDVAGKEFRGVTQHIGAYQIEVDGKKITFIDTPGHEAFADMRARGANVTDVVVLVVAADDGVMPQTVESINHVKAAGVPVIVAVNKIDKSDVNIKRVVDDLLQYEVVPEDLGGDVIVVPVSAKTGENLDQLKANILLVAEMLELKAPVGCRAQGVVIESKIDRSYGVVATVIVQKGTLRKGDIVVVGDSSYGKVRGMFGHDDQAVGRAVPSTPVKVLGLSAVPKVGESFIVVASEKRARDLLDCRSRANALHSSKAGVAGVDVFAQLRNKVEELNVILKADVVGSLEAISYSIAQIVHEEVKFNILHKDVGDVTKSDVLLAETSSASILAFNVKVDAQARECVRQKSVDIRHYRVIYDLIDDVKAMLSGMLRPLKQELQIGMLSVRQVFSSGKGGTVIGCYVSEGVVKRGAIIRIYDGEDVVCEGKIKVLRRFKEDVKEVKNGFECGLLVDLTKAVAVGNTVRVLEIVEHIRSVE